MTNQQTNLNDAKPGGQAALEYILLTLSLCVIALRTMFTEGPNVQSTSAQPINFNDVTHSLSISGLLILLFLCWLVSAVLSKKFLYRSTGLEAGLAIFAIAAAAATFSASNKRAAITDFATIISPVLMAVMLTQILDSLSKIRLALVVVAALGVVSACQCADQFFSGNQLLIEEYEANPQSMLQTVGIQPGSFENMLFEHRLYSKVVRGFFTTSNSAGSFAILSAFAAAALLIEKLRSRRLFTPRPRYLSGLPFTYIIVLALILFGLAITKSKGAILAFIISAIMFFVYSFWSDRLKNHKKIIVTACLLFLVAGVCAVIFYGLAHDRLPGGNSMLVRWQYWCASVKMFADHPLTGVGPGNFTYFYPHYKHPSAPETITDPHNFPLSILTQYGPLGLAGFLLMVFAPLWMICSGASSLQTPPEPACKKTAVKLAIIISIAILLIRPILVPITIIASAGTMIYVLFLFYAVPAIIFIISFLLLIAEGKPSRPAGIVPIAALWCAAVGVLIHNVIDFAIFEPAVWTTFWAVTACLIASDFCQKPQQQPVQKFAAPTKILIAALSPAVFFAYLSYALIPVVKCTARMQEAAQADLNGDFEQAHNFFIAAAKDDPLNPTPLNLDSKLFLQRSSESPPSRQTDLLLGAEKSLLQAVNRNRADYKKFEQLTEIYISLAKTSPQKENGWLTKAFDSAVLAVDHYPGCARLRFQMAEIAEKLGKTSFAVEQYAKAIEIEDGFRKQFQIMYPGRKIVSPFDEENYQLAKEKLKSLPNTKN